MCASRVPMTVFHMRCKLSSFGQARFRPSRCWRESGCLDSIRNLFTVGMSHDSKLHLSRSSKTPKAAAVSDAKFCTGAGKRQSPVVGRRGRIGFVCERERSERNRVHPTLKCRATVGASPGSAVGSKSPCRSIACFKQGTDTLRLGDWEVAAASLVQEGLNRVSVKEHD